jgi:hypothetical protein
VQACLGAGARRLRVQITVLPALLSPLLVAWVANECFTKPFSPLALLRMVESQREAV